MLVTIKTLQQKIFRVEVEESDTVKDLKLKIEKEKGDAFSASCQKLIYAGKILEDGLLVSHYKIEESKFIVAMVTKPKAASGETEKKPEEVQTSSVSVPASEPQPTPPSEPQQPQPAENVADATPTNEPAVDANLDQSEGASMLGNDYNILVEQIMQMGFEKSQVQAALNASFNNPERAVEYLTTGIPDTIPQRPAAPAPQPAAATPETGAVSSNPTPAAGQETIASLRNYPAMREMAREVKNNSTLLVPYMQQIGQAHPELLRYINNHQQEFIEFINSFEDEEEGEGQQPAPAEQGGDAAQQGRHVIQVTPQERDDIEKLTALGFPEPMAVQAYMACMKDVEAAANFLFNNPDLQD